jgi:hypothetical protein
MLPCYMALENTDQILTKFSLKTISSFSPLIKNYDAIYMSQDEYYANTEARLNTLMADDTQARMLKSAWEQWSRDNGSPDQAEEAIEEFRAWLLMTYGVRLYRNHMGYQLPFEVSDEKKYLLFTLKFK